VCISWTINCLDTYSNLVVIVNICNLLHQLGYFILQKTKYSNFGLQGLVHEFCATHRTGLHCIKLLQLILVMQFASVTYKLSFCS